MTAATSTDSGKPGPRNLITDVPGLRVGSSENAAPRSGVTVLLPDEPAVAAIDVRGGGPGTRESDVLALGATVEKIHGLVLSGGSAFGLAAAGAVQHWLAARGTGFRVGPADAQAVVPVVPQAILFDLLNGGENIAAHPSAYEQMATKACAACEADGSTFALGTAGAGYGATTANLKGGLGSASLITGDGITIGALVAVNAIGQATIGSTPAFWAAPFELNGEFGGPALPAPWPADATALNMKGSAPAEQDLPQNTTIAIIATDAALTKAQCHRLAVMAQTGLARALYPVHTPLDGDVVFAISTGRQQLPETAPAALARLGALAANTLARAIARGVYEAASLPDSSPPSWREKYGPSG